MKEQPIRILNVVPNMRAAGIETFIMNVYRNIDREKIQFDFLVHNQKKEFYDEEIEKLGGKIYRLTYKDDKNFLKYIKDLKKFFTEHKEYKIVHGHMQSMMPIYLCIAKKCGIPVRIAHSHNNSYEKSIKGIILHLLSRFSGKYANTKFACSNNAGVYLFGKKSKFEVINNGIETEKFEFDATKRTKIRKQFNINNKDILIGNVGRLEKQKNQLFLINIFNELRKIDNRYKLLIIGEGSLEEKIKKQIYNYDISDSVILLNKIKNVNEFMMAMDIFALPSLYEGLGIVLIEAQKTGLKCITTKDTVPVETNVTDNIFYCPLDKKTWINKIIENSKYDRKVNVNNKLKEFDIKNVVNKIENKYFSLLEKNR